MRRLLGFMAQRDQIFKVAGFDKPPAHPPFSNVKCRRRAREVQGGYGKYQVAAAFHTLAFSRVC